MGGDGNFYRPDFIKFIHNDIYNICFPYNINNIKINKIKTPLIAWSVLLMTLQYLASPEYTNVQMEG